jgi:elongation factor Ts
VLVEVNCETDFVARTDDFQSFAESVAQLVLAERPANPEALSTLDIDGQPVERVVTDMAGKFGEKIEVRRFDVVQSAAGSAVPYIHPGSRLGVVVEVTGSGDAEQTGRDVAMQVAAMNPVAVRREEVPEEIREKELEIGREAARNEGKPEQILDRIAQGKLERYFKDYVLIEQPFVKDASVRVQDVLKQSGLDVHRFIRFALGD